MPRPAAVTILGLLVSLAACLIILIGVASFFVGANFLLRGASAAGITLIVSGVPYTSVGVALGFAGSGLLRMRRWAWGVSVVAVLIILVYLGFTLHERLTAGVKITVPFQLALGTMAVALGGLLMGARVLRGAFLRTP